MAKMSAEQIDVNATCAKVLKRKSRNERKLFLLFHSLLRTVPRQLVMQISLPLKKKKKKKKEMKKREGL